MHGMKCYAILLVITALCSCSPGGAGNITTLYSEAALDGYVTWQGSASYTGSFTGTSVSIGDDVSDWVTRCFVSFDMSSIPAGAQIDAATLRMYQNGTSSGDSYSEPPGLGLGWILVNNTNYVTVPAPTWEDRFNDCTTGADIGIGPISTSFSPNTWHELDVTTSAVDEVNSYHNGRLQFLLYHHYEKSSNGVADCDGWVMGDSATNRPELVIRLK